MGFFELNIAMSGLFAAQRGLQVTSNNISNANTKGYSRQVLSQQASTPLSGLSVGMAGTGVTTTGINRIRDSFIDSKLWTQNPNLGEYNMKVTQNSIVEAAFGEPSDSGFTKVFNNMFSAMSTLSNDPTSKDAKSVLKEEMVSFTKYFNNIAGTLEKQQKDLNFELKGLVEEINTLATHIQNLNKQIFDAEMYGSEASTFRDERDKCIDRLSEIIDTEVKEEEYEVNGNTVKKFSVKIAGQTLVDHFSANTLGTEVREDKMNTSDVDGLYDVVWSNGVKFDMTDTNMSGELKGIIDMRDGAGTTGENKYSGIPYYIGRLNEYVRTFAKAMNEAYSKDEDPKKYALFTYTTGDVDGTPVSADKLDYDQLTAANFSISQEINDAPYDMRTAYDMINNPSDSSFMLGLVGQKNNKGMFNEGDPKDYMVSIFSELGINTQEARMYQNTQVALTNNFKNQRLSVSQVDITEEFTYLVQYQQAYQAAAKVMNTMDGIYETTLFKLGNF